MIMQEKLPAFFARAPAGLAWNLAPFLSGIVSVTIFI
jgi:hypothetical protein